MSPARANDSEVGRARDNAPYPRSTRTSFLILATAVLFAVTARARAADALLAVLHAPPPEFPAAFANEPVTSGAAFVACTIDDDGSVIETWTLGATHLAFATAAENTLRTWRYAATADAAQSSTPWPRFEVVRFVFTRSGTITSHTAQDAARRLFRPEHRDLYETPELPPLVPAAQLQRLEGSLPRVAAREARGEVIVEFVVNAEGRVRLPIALQAPDRTLARSAVSAVRAWRFALPDAATPIVRTRWAFRFPAQPAP